MCLLKAGVFQSESLYMYNTDTHFSRWEYGKRPENLLIDFPQVQSHPKLGSLVYFRRMALEHIRSSSFFSVSNWLWVAHLFLWQSRTNEYPSFVSQKFLASDWIKQQYECFHIYKFLKGGIGITNLRHLLECAWRQRSTKAHRESPVIMRKYNTWYETPDVSVI